MFQIVQINTEFVFFDTCGDIVMGMGIDIGIDAKGDPGFFAQPGRDPVDHLYFRQGLTVETKDIVL